MTLDVVRDGHHWRLTCDITPLRFILGGKPVDDMVENETVRDNTYTKPENEHNETLSLKTFIT
jgi:hypothetical protein